MHASRSRSRVSARAAQVVRDRTCPRAHPAGNEPPRPLPRPARANRRRPPPGSAPLAETEPLRVEPKSPSGRKRAAQASPPTGKSETPPAPAPRNRAAEGRGEWRSGVLPPEERGPASLLRADRDPRLPPLAGAGPAHRHRLGRLARSRAATRDLGMKGLTARASCPRESRRRSGAWLRSAAGIGAWKSWGRGGAAGGVRQSLD